MQVMTNQSQTMNCGDCDYQFPKINDKSVCPKCGSSKKSHKISIIESVAITDSVSIQLGLYFELAEPVAVPKNFKNSNKVILSVNNGMLQSFQINSSPEDIIDTIHKANKFVSYLSFKTGLYVSHKHPRKVINGKIIIEEKGGISADSLITDLRALDLTNPKFEEFLSNPDIDYLKLAHFTAAQKAIDQQNWSEAIRELYLTIEDSNIPEKGKYRHLRNAVSHTKIDNPNSPSILKNEFGIDLPRGSSLDILDPVIMGKLEKATKELRGVSWHHIAPNVDDF